MTRPWGDEEPGRTAWGDGNGTGRGNGRDLDGEGVHLGGPLRHGLARPVHEKLPRVV